MSKWNLIYENFNPIAFKIFDISVHWYGIMYVLALISSLWAAKFFAKRSSPKFDQKMLDSYFFYVEIGVILGARLGYIFIYSNEQIFYLTHPWQIFNPFSGGEFVGIRGMSYHGALIGFIIATMIFCRKRNQNIWRLLDLVAISVPLGYTFGRVGNFLNQELIGRVTTEPWGILVNGNLHHPSQLYEAFLEGICVFILMIIIRKFKKFDGELISFYVIFYSIARFICEIYRQPDVQLGFLFAGLSMGQILSIIMLFIGIVLFIYTKKRAFILFKAN